MIHNSSYTKKLTIFLVIFFGVLGFGKVSLAATINAASCSQVDVQTAINAASTGDTVSVPSGSCTWTGGITINKAVYLVGAGIGNTIITDNSVRNYTVVPIWVTFSTDGDDYARISGFTFLDTGTGIDGFNGLITISSLGGSGTPSVRIDNIYFNGTKRRCILSYNTRGLIDHVIMNSCSNIFARPDGQSANEWEKNVPLGSQDAWFIEDSTFNYSSGSPDLNDQQNGTRLVIRHNSFTASGTFNAAFLQNHGFDSVDRGGMWREVYNNTFTNNALNYVGLSQLRGGSGVFYNNTVTGNYWTGLGLTNYRSCSDYNFPGYCIGGKYDESACNAGSGCTSGGGTCYTQLCNGTNPGDGTGIHGYPCIDQIGRTGNQAFAPVYEWNNTLNGNDLDFSVYTWSANCPNQAEHIQVNRDYFNDTQMPGYVAYTYPHPFQSGSTPTPNCGDQSCNNGETCSSCPSDCGTCPVQDFLPGQYIEAESGTLSSPMQISSDTSASGGEYISVPLVEFQGSASYTFNIQQAGKYKMEAKVLAQDGGSNSFYIGLDDQNPQSTRNNYYAYHIPINTTFTWANVSLWGNGVSAPQFDPMLWDLTQGTHTFTFYGRESNTWLDQIRLVSLTTDTTPPAAPSGVTVI